VDEGAGPGVPRALWGSEAQEELIASIGLPVEDLGILRKDAITVAIDYR